MDNIKHFVNINLFMRHIKNNCQVHQSAVQCFNFCLEMLVFKNNLNVAQK